jgi:ribosomal-protein-alanine N-acetyltransferase
MLSKLANLHKLCFPDKPWSSEEFATLKKSGCEIIASENGFIVWRAAADEAEIISMGVHPDHRGAGVGDALLQLMEKEIIAMLRHGGCIGKAKIFLEVAENNTAARKLYERNGYARVATRPGYYDGVDAVVMRKESGACK